MVRLKSTHLLFQSECACAACSVRFLLFSDIHSGQGTTVELDTYNWPPNIMLVDDNPLSSLLILRLFNFLDYDVLHIEHIKELEKEIYGTHTELMLLNLALTCDKENWGYFTKMTKLVCYPPDLLIKDFMQTRIKALHTQDDNWMLESEFFKFLTIISK